MKFKMIHENYNVSDLDRSIKFYNEALDLHEVRRKTTNNFIIAYLSNDVSDFELELTWLKDHPQPGKFQLKITYIVAQIHDDKIIGSLSSHLVQIKGLVVKFNRLVQV